MSNQWSSYNKTADREEWPIRQRVYKDNGLTMTMTLSNKGSMLDGRDSEVLKRGQVFVPLVSLSES